MCSAFYYPSHYLIGRLHLSLLKPRISPNFDAISLDTSNLTSNLTSSQTNWEYLQSISISHSIS